MNKLEIQKRVLQNGEPLHLDKFEWNEKAKTFSTVEDNLVLDFNNIDNIVFTTGWCCTFKTGSNCTFTTNSYCTFTTGSNCTFTTDLDCTFTTGSHCTFTTDSDCTFKTNSYCTFTTDSDCTFTTGWCCTFKTGSNCTFTTGSHCTFTTDSDCTFKTGSDCTFTTDSDCTFTTGSHCTFTTTSYCTFKTGLGCTFTTDSRCTFTTSSDCTFKTGTGCVIVRRDVLEVIQPKGDDIIQLCPYQISGHLINGLKDGIPHIIADGILSKVISKKGDIYKVINHGDTKQSYLVKSADKYSHGETLKQARDSLVYKLADRDTSKYKDLTLESVLSKDESISCYMSITGACELGTKYFVDRQKMKTKYSIKEIIQLTKGQYGNDAFAKFFK